MSNTLIVVIASIVVLFLLLPFLFLFRRRVDLELEGDVLILNYPLTTKKIDLNKELKSWELQRAAYFRLGAFYAITMRFKNEKRVMVSSLLNQENYNLLFRHLNSRFKDRRKPEVKQR